MGNAPAFQLYAADFYMDTLTWDCDDVGAYFRLLMFEWVNGFLPKSEQELAKIAQKTSQKFIKNWSKISQKFTDNGNGFLINLRLEATREKQKKFQESQRLKGFKSGVSRTNRGSTGVQPKSNRGSTRAVRTQSNLSSSSSSSSSNKDLNNKILFLDFVYLTEQENEKLKTKFGETGTIERIESLNNYIGQIGTKEANKRYTSHYFTILNWERKHGGNGSGTKPAPRSKTMVSVDEIREEQRRRQNGSERQPQDSFKGE